MYIGKLYSNYYERIQLLEQRRILLLDTLTVNIHYYNEKNDNDCIGLITVVRVPLYVTPPRTSHRLNRIELMMNDTLTTTF